MPWVGPLTLGTGPPSRSLCVCVLARAGERESVNECVRECVSVRAQDCVCETDFSHPGPHTKCVPGTPKV